MIIFDMWSLLGQIVDSGFIQWDFRDPQGRGTPWAPYYSRTTPIRILKDMGMVWELYGKLTIRGPIIGGPWNHPWFMERKK